MPKWLLRWFSPESLSDKKDEHNTGIEGTLSHPEIVDKRKSAQPIEPISLQGESDPYVETMLAAALQDDNGNGVIGSVDDDGKLTIRDGSDSSH